MMLQALRSRFSLTRPATHSGLETAPSTLPPSTGAGDGTAGQPTMHELLAAARLAFTAALEGLYDDEALALRLAEQRATNLRELWHLRMPLFNLIARAHSEFEARRRLSRLDMYFAMTRSG